MSGCGTFPQALAEEKRCRADNVEKQLRLGHFNTRR